MIKNVVYGFKSRTLGSVFAAAILLETPGVQGVRVERCVLPTGEKPWSVVYYTGEDTLPESVSMKDIRDLIERYQLPEIDNH